MWALHAQALSWTRRFDQAIAFGRKAIEQRRILIALHPENTHVLSELALSQVQLAESLLGTGLSNWQQAEQQLLSALEIQHQAVAHSDATSFERRVLGGILRALAEISKITNHVENANQYLDEARQIFEQLCRDEPTVLSHPIDLGSIWIEIACCASLAGDSAGEIAAFDKSVDILEPVVAKAPENIVSTTSLARTYSRLGDRLVATDPAQALDYFDRGVSMFDGVLKQERQNRNAIAILPDLLTSRARLLAESNRPNDALVDCRRAISMAEGDDRGSIQLNCAMVMAIAGDYGEAAEQAQFSMEDMAARCDPHFLASMWKLAAEVLVKSAVMAQADQGLDVEQRKGQVDRYCAMALDMLSKGAKSGLNVSELADSADFAILYDDPRFKKMAGQ